MNARERMLAACSCQPVDRPPVWLMRQAGRYLPAYRALRTKHDFWTLMRTPRLAVEVSLQPIRQFGMDAAIVFSDILTIHDAMGAEVRYGQGGPRIQPLVHDAQGLDALGAPDVDGALSFVGEAVERLCTALHPDTAVIGFAGAPFTLAAYLVEEGPGKDLTRLLRLARNDPATYGRLLDLLAGGVVDLLRMQLRAGADLVQIFDTWAGSLTPAQYEELALPFTRKVIERLQPAGAPVILYVRASASRIEAMASSGCNGLSIDDSLSLSAARRRCPPDVFLQGNLDPALLASPPARVRELVHAMISEAGPTGTIVNLGRGLTPATPVEGVDAFVQAVKEWAP